MGNSCAGGGRSEQDAKEKANAGSVAQQGPPQPPPQQQKRSSQQQEGPQEQKKAVATEQKSTPGMSLTQSVLGRRTDDLKTKYILGRELGRGQFGVTHLCTDKETQEQLACKSIAKRKLTTKEDVEDVRREVAIMHHLLGQANIVQLKGSYEDKHAVHLVMELCGGGELFDRIIARGHYSERAAAGLTRTIVGVVQTCHSLNVMHRDLKPENFLLASKREDSELKATDFGLSVFFKPGEKFNDVVGSAYYVAPEVLRRSYGPEADVWSAGIILYILLSGVPPFWAETESGIFDAILKGHYDLVSPPWPSISASAKDLVKKMLRQDPKDRLSAHQVLIHPWIREDGEAPDKPLDNAVLSRLKQFAAMNKLKKLALKIIASSLSEEEITGLKEMFKAIDADHSGAITYEELKEGLRRQGCQLAESEMRALMEAADVDNNGTIDYEEFVAATMHMAKLEKEEHLVAAFQHFDVDGSGEITVQELEAVMTGKDFVDKETIHELVEEIDTNKDGKIDYEEFVMMMKKGNPAGEMASLRKHLKF